MRTETKELDLIPNACGDLRETVGHRDLFHYVYAILHAPSYRSGQDEALRVEFAKIPLSGSAAMIRELCVLGSHIASLHLMAASQLENHITTLAGSGNFQVEKVSYSDETVWIDKAKTRGFKGVPEDDASARCQ